MMLKGTHDLVSQNSWINFAEAGTMPQKNMYWKLKETTYFHGFLGNFLVPEK